MRLTTRAACLCFLLTCPVSSSADDWQEKFATPQEQGDGWDTAEYQTAIRFYQSLSAASDRVSLHTMGETDSGHPLHLVLISTQPLKELAEIRNGSQAVLLINNAIHPGESDGVDASMALARDLAFAPESQAMLKRVTVAIVPLYNIGGALNRNTGTRANQNGPREYGFRGNGRNYDLNRDFIKADTLNTRSFIEIFQTLDPDLFIDTHVSNGADYQHVMTTTHSQKDKLGFQLGKYLHETFEPRLFGRMKEAGFPTIPYVNSGGRPPEDGFAQFLETPRYSTGYAALFQTMGFMTETHMLKPYPQRVKATRTFLDQAIRLLADEGATIRNLRQKDRTSYRRQRHVAIAWKVDPDKASRLEFHGYESRRIDSNVTPGKRLFYDRTKPFTRNIPYSNHYLVSRSVELPSAYLIPRQWRRVIESMRRNRVEMRVVTKRSACDAEVYRIDTVKSRKTPYEGHFFHDSVTVSKHSERVTAVPGDVLIPIDQDRARFVVETLEPEAMDSLFRWNFFDTILQRKEYFSPYVFETTAEALLASDANLRSDFEERKRADPEFADDRDAQLEFLYQRSPHYETAHRRYPVVRVIGELP